MNNIIPYLVFPGTCREALNFYADCLSAKITSITTFGESPVNVPNEVTNRIFNADLQAGDFILKASDDMPGYEVSIGTNVSLYLVFNDVAEKKNAFAKLAVGGQVQFPIEDNFGMLKDKFGVQWMMVSK